MAKKSCHGCRTKFMCADRWGRFRGNDRIRRLPWLVNRLRATCSPAPTSRRGRKPLIDQNANTKANGSSTSAEYFDRTGSGRFTSREHILPDEPSCPFCLARRRRLRALGQNGCAMANNHRPEVRASDLRGLKYFKILGPLLERLHDEATQRDRAGNRQLFFDQYASLLLLYFFNPIVTSLRGIQQA